MFLDSDFDQIKTLLQRACDQCLLTRKHCQSCDVDRLHGIIEGIERGSKPSYLVSGEELATLLSPTSPNRTVVAEKWNKIIAGNGGIVNKDA
ncbi:MAG: hypothetical protein ACOY46_03380 [Bacillota bacterium]